MAAAVLLGRGLGDEVDVLRRALGDPSVPNVPPHLTLVPPVNVRGPDLPAALATLRDAVAGAEPFELRLGPVASFEPVTPTVHLAVSGDLDALAALRAALFRPPLWRAVTFPFVPHVTLRDQAPLHVLHSARQALAAYRAHLEVARVTLLAEERAGPGRRRWVPVADGDLGGVRVVGRGGLPTELAAGTLVDPEARAAFEGVPAQVRPPVVTARREGEVVAVGWDGGAVGREVEVADLVRAEVVRRAG